MILSNQVRCHKCNDEPFSATVHDFKPCKCGAIAVDGGPAYLRRVGDIAAYDDMSIEINDAAFVAAKAAVKWANDTGRNEYGVVSAVARAFRDNGVAIFDSIPRAPIDPNSDEEADLEQACFASFNDNSLPIETRRLIQKLWREVCARELAVIGYRDALIAKAAIKHG